MILVDITAHAGKPRPCLGGGQVRCQVRIRGFDYDYNDYVYDYTYDYDYDCYELFLLLSS